MAVPSALTTPLLLDQLLQAHRPVGRVVVDELERGRALEVQLAGEAALQEAVGAAQARQGVLALLGPTGGRQRRAR